MEQSLKCRKCFTGFLSVPARTCKKRHLLCAPCSRHRHCPVCGRKLQQSRLDDEVARLLRPCPNRGAGCHVMAPAAEVVDHVELCEFQELRCAALLGGLGCSWAGPVARVTRHLLDQHFLSDDFRHAFVLEKYSGLERYSACVLLACFRHLFVARLEYDPVYRVFFGGVQFVSGPRCAAREFRYEFEAGKTSANGAATTKMAFSRHAHGVMERYSPSDDHFRFHRDVGACYTDDRDVLTLTVVIKDVSTFARKRVEARRVYGFVPVQYCQRCADSFNPDGY